MKKLDGISLTAVLAAAAALGACGENESAWRVCVDDQGRRVVDDQCAAPAGHGAFAHWYYSRGSAPALGGTVSGGSSQAEDGVSYASPPSEGITRGGFGGTADEGGSEHGGGGGDGGGE